MRVRFTLRDLFWLMVVAALAVGYWHERQKNEPKRYELFVTADGKELHIVDRETRITRIMSPPGSNLPNISENRISD
jgi:hypothetical protein